jgi:DNA (cytosine-5)-methyltransferase 1
LAQPAVGFWRGTRVSFPDARVFLPGDTDLATGLRKAARRGGFQGKAIDLFSGAGGLSLGLEQAGFNVILAADSDGVSCETHAAAFEGVTVQADLSRPDRILQALSRAGITTVDLVAGGPPCQPFSRAGRSKIRSLERVGRRARDDRPLLWHSFMRFVKTLSPMFVLIENVPDMVLWDRGQTIRDICGSLELQGYDVRTRVFECWRFGVPQHRQRLFITAAKRPGSLGVPTMDEVVPSLRDAIGDLPPVGPAQRNYWLPYNGRPRTKLQERLRDGASLLSDHMTRDVRPDDRAAFRLLKRGKRYGDLPRNLRRYRSDIFDDKYTILSWGALSRSITAHIAKDGYWYIHPDGRRMLSIREAARLQTFPDPFRFAGYPSDRLRQIGNAVPVEVARRLGEAMVLDVHRQTSGQEPAPFRAAAFRRRLVAWYARSGRHYPWRETKNPWLVLATEILLRRTRADAVASVWGRFRSRFKSPAAVLRSRAELRRTLHPLGLRWRVENLIEVARELTKRFDGRVPTSREELMSLPGVGDYVADAVLAFALGERAVLVDSNTARIASRVFGLEQRWSSLRNLNLRASVARLGGVRPPRPEVNMALMDLGGTVCLPRQPRCESCPVRDLCAYGTARIQIAGKKMAP